MDYWIIAAGILVAFAVTLSFYEIVRHLLNFNKPFLQRYIIRILLMVPIYSLNAWIAMTFPVTGLYLDSMREVYESFVIYSFMKYLLNFLRYDTNLQQYIDHKKGPGHIFPFCFLPACVGGRSFMIRCKHGILQYVVVRPTTTLIAFASQVFDFYGEGNYNPFSGYTYPVLLIVNNASQLLAMYCLVIFYTGYQQELRPMRPLAKFFSIKLVVFFSFFQSVVISGLLELDFVEDTFKYLFPDVSTKVGLGRKAQELLICMDMLIAAIGHLYAFSYKPFVDNVYETYESDQDLYEQDTGATQGCCHAMRNLFDFTDEKSDFAQVFERIASMFNRNPPLPAIVSNTSDCDSNTSLNREEGFSVIESTSGDKKKETTAHSQAPNPNYRSIE